MGKSMWIYPFIFFIILPLQFAYSTPSLSYSPHNHLCPYEQGVLLLKFKQKLSIESSASYVCHYNGQSSRPKTTSWKTGTDCCAWDGVMCNVLTGHVIGLDLSCSQLKGIIHSNSTLFQLSHLKRLNLAYNDFSSSRITREFSRFATTLAHLNLSHSHFSGQVSSEISHLSKLISLDLSDNAGLWIIDFKMLLQNLTQLRELSLFNVNISLAVPMNLSSSLTVLDLSWTGLHGILPDKIFHLPNLQTLDLSGNHGLTGPFPEVNVTSSSPLRWLDLSNTNLLGEIPHSIGNLKSLNYLKLRGCKFSGSIPELLGNLTQITHLDITSNNFSGEIPSTLSNLKKLTDLGIAHNNFGGEIPSTLSNLEQLTHLDISRNNFGGVIPSTLSNLEQLTLLDFSYNNLGGQIPNFFAKLKHLSSLSLQDNNFSGPFPSSITNLTQLVSLVLSSNSFMGPIPSDIVGLHNLTDVVIFNNSFSGAIPYWLFALPLLKYIDLGLNRFTGQILDFQSKSLEVVDMRNNDLNGSIPQSISKCMNLTYLKLSGNNLTDIVELETYFANLKNLEHLDLSYNSLSVSTTNTSINATLPNLYLLGLASCKMKEFPYLLKDGLGLTVLDLSYNQINDQLPNWTLSLQADALYYLRLESNLLQGPLPSSICHFRHLQILDLSDNRFDGTILQCLGNFSDNLSVLDLRMNRFFGTIPTTFGAKGNKLRSLNLHGNELEGTLPRSLANCTHLQILDVGNNQINDTFPHWSGTLPQLQVLVLRYNRFHGPIISTFNTKFPFSKLPIIDLSHNQFTGFLPQKYFMNFKAMINMGEDGIARKYMRDESYGNYYDEITLVTKGMEIKLVRILTIFTTIDLSSNKFEGEILNLIGNLNSLRVLNLSHNSLAGRIPAVLGNLFVLESLDLSSNQLVGEVPQQLTSLTFLAVLNLSQNHLVGIIPQGKQFNTFPNASYSGNAALCGFPLSKKCGDDETAPPPSSQQTDDSAFASGFTWKVVFIGYGCGTLFGLVMGYLMFSTGKPKWFTKIVERGHHKNVKSPLKRGYRRYGRRY